MDLTPSKLLSPAITLEAFSRALSAAGRALVVIAVEELERIVVAAVTRAIDAGDWIETPGGRTFGEAFDAFMTARELAGTVRDIDEEKILARSRIRPAAFFDGPIR